MSELMVDILYTAGDALFYIEYFRDRGRVAVLRTDYSDMYHLYLTK